jgi:hypothetical protein
VLAIGLAGLDAQVAQRFGVLGAVQVIAPDPDPETAPSDPAPTLSNETPTETVPAGEVSAADTPAAGAPTDGASAQRAPLQPPVPETLPAAPSPASPSVAAEASPAQAAMPTGPDTSLNQRLAMLQAGWKAFLEAPWRGHGGQNRFKAAAPYLPENFEAFSHLHNDFLTHAVAGGVPAVVLLCLILAFPLLCALRRPNRDRILTALLFSGAFTGTALTNNVLFVDISAFALGLAYATALKVIENN